MSNDLPQGVEATRQAAEGMGRVRESSFTEARSEVVAWAFAVERGDERLVLAGSVVREPWVALAVHADHPVSGMIYAKAIAALREPLVVPSVVRLVGQHQQASWPCDAFLLSEGESRGLRPGDLWATGLHAEEIGLDAATVTDRVNMRAPGGRTTPDPAAGSPVFRTWVKLLRALRRIERSKALAAPQLIIDNDITLARRAWQKLGGKPLTTFPADVLPLAQELDLSRDPP